MQQRMVRLRHPELDRETRQPLSTARVLLDSGWEAADDDAQEALDGGKEQPQQVNPKTASTKASSTKTVEQKNEKGGN